MEACPNSTQLEQLLSNELHSSEQARLTVHLESCPLCQLALQKLAAGEATWSAAARLGAEGFASERPSERLPLAMGASPSTSLPSLTPPDSLATDDVLHDLLEPLAEPGSLGRLGHYEVTGVIGRGGMGIVLKGHDQKLHRVVAIKVMAPLLASNPRSRTWFLREAQSAAAINDDHVVTIHSVEEARGVPFLVMQFVEGESLQQRLQARGALELSEVLRIGQETALGLAAAHARGIIHRDVKPGNILLEARTGRVKLTDFGLARAIDTSASQTGLVAGTPQYMAPEQAAGEPIDHRADLYSLGGVLYAMCTGRPPVQTTGQRGESTNIAAATASLPPRLAAIIARLRADMPQDRYATAAEVAELLAAYRADIERGDEVDWQPATTAPRRRRHLTRLAAAVVCGVTLVLLALELSGVTRLNAPLRRFFATPDPPAAVPPAPILDPPLAPHEVRRFVGHNLWVATVAVSPDGRLALSGSADKTVRLWEIASGKQLKCLAGHGALVISVAFLPDGRGISSGLQDKTLILWDLTRGEEIRRIEWRDSLHHVAVAPDGAHLLSGSLDRAIVFWDVETGEMTRVFRGHPGFVHCAICSRDGRSLISGGLDANDNKASAIRLWDVASLQQTGELVGHGDMICSLALSRDGRHVLSGSGDGTMRLWELETRAEVRRYEHPDRVGRAAYLPDGRHAVTACSDKMVRVWHLDTGKEVARFAGHTGPVHGIAPLPDGRHVLSAGDKTLRLWRLPDHVLSP